MRNKLPRPRFSTAPQARLLAGVLAVATAYPLHAQTGSPLAPLASTGSAPGQMVLRADPSLRDIVVETDANNLPGDGRSSVAVTVRLLDADGRPLEGTSWITVDSNGGRIVDTAAVPGTRLGVPVDRLLRGTRIKVENGVGRFQLIAPAHPQENQSNGMKSKLTKDVHDRGIKIRRMC